MKKYNFLVDPPDPSEPTGDSTGGLSPQAKRLLIIGLLGIILAGALYVYKSFFIAVPPPPPPPLALKQNRVQPPPASVKPPEVNQESVKPPVPPMPVSPPVVKPEAVEPPVAVRTAAPEKEGEKAAPTSPPAAAEVEKPIPKAVAKVAKPEITREEPYALQVASLVVEGNVLSLKKRLEALGYRPDVRKVTARITLHRVYGAEFDSREEAEETARRLNVDGVPSTLVEVEGGKFGVEIGSSFQLNEAIDLARTLQKRNYTPKIVSEASSTTVHQIRVGAYENRAEAQKALEALKKQGFAPLIVKR